VRSFILPQESQMRQIAIAVAAAAAPFTAAQQTPPPQPAGGAAVTVEQPAARGGDLIPRDVIFGNPDRASLQISPDGRRFAFIAPHNEVMNVWVQTVGRDDGRAVTSSTDRPIRTYFWAQNSEQIIYAQDKGGNENFHLYAVDLDSGAERDLTPYENVQARVVAADRNFPDEILVAVNNRPPHQLHDVHRVNTRTGESSLVYENTEGWFTLAADSDFNIRLATRMTPEGGSEAYVRNPGDDEWTLLAAWDQEDMLTSSPMGFSRDGDTLYTLDSRERDTAALYAVDLSRDGFAKEEVAASEKADIQGVEVDPDTGEPQAVSWYYTREEWHILDESIAEDWKYLESVDDGDMSIGSRDNDDDTWTVVYVDDNGPAKYYLYDREARKATYLFTNRPALEGYTLSEMHPIVIQARDGLKLVSYLTLPAGETMETAESLPMVLLVHGGPWGRDTWGYNSLHQWLSNRGYAVLSVNFRGSTGFGKEFVNAGDRQWAAAMHNDLLDATAWAIDEGIADPERIAIMGGSYGGYATLVGLTFTPEVFAAGVDIVGPSHVRTLLESIPPYWKPMLSLFESRVGALSEPEYLDSISPLTKVDQIRRPLLIGQGANDPRVKQAESEQIVAAMQENNIPVTYVVFPDEGHGFARPENNLAFFAVTEAFLAQHLNGKYEPIDDDVRSSSAEIKVGAELIPGLDTN
jgi:dipeptidyl aminopeptidase/acylaminoacyl peptidase